VGRAQRPTVPRDRSSRTARSNNGRLMASADAAVVTP
jgi:hypothetical protein